jgi:hypothetical protein
MAALFFSRMQRRTLSFNPLKAESNIFAVFLVLCRGQKPLLFPLCVRVKSERFGSRHYNEKTFYTEAGVDRGYYILSKICRSQSIISQYNA